MCPAWSLGLDVLENEYIYMCPAWSLGLDELEKECSATSEYPRDVEPVLLQIMKKNILF